MRLSPVPAVRTCTACGHRWFTAIAAACTCPACLAPLDAPAVWPHVCGDGHSAQAGGECQQCVRVVAKESVAAPVREWRNR